MPDNRTPASREPAKRRYCVTMPVHSPRTLAAIQGLAKLGIVVEVVDGERKTVAASAARREVNRSRRVLT